MTRDFIIGGVLFVVCGLGLAYTMCKAAATPDGRTCPRPPKPTQVRSHQPRPRPTLPVNVDDECRSILARAFPEDRR